MCLSFNVIANGNLPTIARQETTLHEKKDDIIILLLKF
jgi:hypothetical protein